MLYLTHDKPHRTPWNKGKLTGQETTTKTQRGLGYPYSITDCQ